MHVLRGLDSRYNAILCDITAFQPRDTPAVRQKNFIVPESNTLYQMLIEIYDKTEQYSHAIALMERLLWCYPDDPRLKVEIDSYKVLVRQQKSQ